MTTMGDTGLIGSRIFDDLFGQGDAPEADGGLLTSETGPDMIGSIGLSDAPSDEVAFGLDEGASGPESAGTPSGQGDAADDNETPVPDGQPISFSLSTWDFVPGNVTVSGMPEGPDQSYSGEGLAGLLGAPWRAVDVTQAPAETGTSAVGEGLGTAEPAETPDITQTDVEDLVPLVLPAGPDTFVFNTGIGSVGASGEQVYESVFFADRDDGQLGDHGWGGDPDGVFEPEPDTGTGDIDTIFDLF